MVISNQIISFKLSGINYTGTSTQLNYTSGVTQGEAQANKSLVLDVNKSATGIGTIGLATLIATNVGGTLTTAAQPNITSVGTLSSLNVNGTLSATGLTLNSVGVAANATELNYLSAVTVGAASPSKALVVNSSRAISNLSSLATTDLAATGVFTYKGTAVTADGTRINYIDTVPGTAAANKAIVLDSSRDISNVRNFSASSVSAASVAGTLTTAAQPNITSVGTLSSLALGGAISGATDITASGTVSAQSLTAAHVTGTLATAAQPNITSVGTLASLAVGGALSCSSLGVSSITLGGTQLLSTALELNRLNDITLGTASAGKALVVDASRDLNNIRNLSVTSLTATNIQGSVQTASQPNITSLGALTGLTVANGILSSYVNNSATASSYYTASNLSSSGTITVRTELSNAIARIGTSTEHPLRFMSNNSTIMSLDTNSNVSIGATTPSEFKLNVAGSINSSSISIAGTAVTASAGELNFLSGISAGAGSASKALVLDSSRNINNVNQLTASSVIATTVAGTLSTAAQPNVTSLGTLTGLEINSSGNGLNIQNTTSSGSASFRLTNNLRMIELGFAGNGSANNANSFYIVDGSNTRLSLDSAGNFAVGGSANPGSHRLNVIGSLNASNLFLNNSAVTATAAELNFSNGVTAGTCAPNKVLVADSSRDISNIRNLTATSLIGTLGTSAQPSITSVGTLTSLALSGAVTGVTNLTASGTVSASILAGTTITGTVSTAAQPNITSLGTLTAANISGSLKIGVINSSPADVLHIEGNSSTGIGMQIENRNTTSNSLTYMRFTGYSATNDNYDLASISCGYVAANANFGYGYLAFATRNNSNSTFASERMRITESGNVGIMKTNPAYTLDVDGSVNATEFRIGGTAISATAADLNRLASVTAGSAAPGKAVVLDSLRDVTNIRNLSASTLSGTLAAGSQAGITEVGTLTNLTVNGPTTIQGTSITLNGPTSFAGNNVSSIASLSAVNLTGTLQTGAQPNITSLGNLSAMNCTGSVKIGSTGPAAQDFIHVEGSSNDTIGIQLDNNSTVGNSGTHIKFNGYNISNNNYDIARITCGYVAANANFGHGYLAFSTRNVSTDTFATERMRITQNGAVGIGTNNPSYSLDVNGVARATRFLANSADTGRLASFLNPSQTINTDEFITLGRANSANNQAEFSFTYAGDGSSNNCLKIGLHTSARRFALKGNGYVGINMPVNNPFTIDPLHVNQVGTSTSICMTYDAGVNSAGVRIGTTTNNKLYVNNGAVYSSSNTPSTTGYVVIDGFESTSVPSYGYCNDNGQVGYIANPGGGIQVSLRCSHRVVAGQEINLVSDSRMKKEIQEIPMDYCKKFINTVTPKSYMYKSESTRTNGFIAQEIVKNGFNELFGFAQEDVAEHIDSDGFVSPAGTIFTVNYDAIIPILTNCVKDLYKENAELKARLESLESLIKK